MGRRRAKRSAGKPPYRPTGSGNVVGHCYLFLFPFDVYCRGEFPAPVEIRIDSTLHRFYPPYRNDDSRDSNTPAIKLGAVPRPQGTADPSYRAPWGDPVAVVGWKKESRRCDALRVDCEPDPRGDPNPATRLVHRLLRLIRNETMQWWIGKDRRDNESYLRGGFPINERQERVSDHTMLYAHASAGFFIERALEYPLFHRLVRGLGRTVEPPVFRETLLDAMYFHATEEIRRSLLEAAISAEAAISFFAEAARERGEIGPADVSSLEDRDFLRRFDGGMKHLVGRSFKEDKPEEAEWLRQMWIARGHIAHAKAPFVTVGGSRRDLSRADATQMINAVVVLASWLGAVGWSRDGV